MAVQFDTEKLIANLRRIPGLLYSGSNAVLKAEQLTNLRELLGFIASDDRWKNKAEIAYFLATVAHEAKAKRSGVFISLFKPIVEMGGTAYFTRRYWDKVNVRNSLGNKYPTDGALFHGRGYVQNTGRRNARISGEVLAGTVITDEDIIGSVQSASIAFKLAGGSPLTVTANSFIEHPDLLLIPKISYLDASARMRKASISYTGKVITDYIHSDTKYDFINARRVINGKDRAEDIAAMAEMIHQALKKAPSSADITPTKSDLSQSDSHQPSSDSANIPTADNNNDVEDEFNPTIEVVKSLQSNPVARPLLARTIGGASTIFAAISSYLANITVRDRIVLAFALTVITGIIVWAYLHLTNNGHLLYVRNRIRRWIKSFRKSSRS